MCSVSNSKFRCGVCREYFPVEEAASSGISRTCKGCAGLRDGSGRPGGVRVRPGRGPVNRSVVGRKVRSDAPVDTRERVGHRDVFCRWCGRPYQHLHHIRYRSEFGRDDPAKHHPDNLIFLCHSCHQLVHTKKRVYQPILLELVHLPPNVLGKDLLKMVEKFLETGAAES